MEKFLLKVRTENGERRTENGERRTENGERRTENGERRTENGERRTAFSKGSGFAPAVSTAVFFIFGYAPFVRFWACGLQQALANHSSSSKGKGQAHN